MTIAQERVAVATRLFIDGREVDGEEGVLTIEDPARGGTVGTAAAASRDQALEAVRAAKAAFPGWAALTPQERAAKIDAAVAAIAPHFEEQETA